MEFIGPLGVRKGGWTAEEDLLLRRYVEKHGEGKWHQIPLRAGLNRCRKSCRLRWLNYLKPTIKRGSFGVDEIDMMVRLQKLLGNRWSLIAGRLPGRTANDVKNFWNTHLRMKYLILSDQESEKEAKQPEDVVEAKIIRPEPRKLSKILPLSMGSRKREVKTNIGKMDQDSFTEPTISAIGEIDGTFWWDNMELDDTAIKCSSIADSPEVDKVISPRLHATSVDTSVQEWWDNMELVDTGIKWSSIADSPEDEKVNISPGLHATSVDTSVQEWWDNMELDHTGITWSSTAALPEDEKVISQRLHATSDTFVQESLQSDLNGYFTNCVDLWGLLAD